MTAQDVFAELLTQRDAELFVTFNWPYRVRPQRGEATVTRFLNGLQSSAYGRSWPRRRGHERIVALGSWEHLESNAHLHALISAPAVVRRLIKYEGRHRWKLLTCGGQLCVRRVYNQDSLARYMTKELRKYDDLDRIFVYAPPQRSDGPPDHGPQLLRKKPNERTVGARRERSTK